MGIHPQALTKYGILLAGIAIAANVLPAQVSPAAEQTIFEFVYPDGYDPQASLTYSGGVFYGTASQGGDLNNTGAGTFYSLTPPQSGSAWTLNLLYTFGGAGDAANPTGNLVAGKGGVLYGISSAGGTVNVGTVFSLTPPASPGGAWTEKVLHSFDDGDGQFPYGELAIARNGDLYGTTYDGQNVFRLSPPKNPGGNWHDTTLYTFDCGATCVGGGPTGVVIGKNGVLYGTTVYGGSTNCLEGLGCGIVYSLTPPASAGGPWTESTIYTFTGEADGESPQGLTMGSDGTLYIPADFGGPGFGTVVSLTPPATPGGAWTPNVLYTFAGGEDGAQPTRGMIIGPGGVLYGTTSGGGKGSGQGLGTVFSLTPPASPGGAWTEAILFRFDAHDGYEPLAGVTLGPGNTLFGTAASGGPGGGGGVIFSLAP